jgi:hypothetical protein
MESELQSKRRNRFSLSKYKPTDNLFKQAQSLPDMLKMAHTAIRPFNRVCHQWFKRLGKLNSTEGALSSYE